MRKALPVLVSSVLLWLSNPVAAGFGMPDALTSRGKLVGEMYDMVTILAIATFMIVFVWLVILIWRFREGTGHGRATHEKERHSLKAELTWTFIPLIMVLFIGYSAYGGLVALDHPKDANGNPLVPEVDILVTGSQWTWEADYGNAAGEHGKRDSVRIQSNPDPANGHVSEANTFLVPQDTAIRFNITSSDVIHAWQVLDANRAFVMFVDANPLGANKYNEQVVSLPAGDYFVQCNKMCFNPGHAYMHAAIRAVPRPMYDQWILHNQIRSLEPSTNGLFEERDITITDNGISLVGNQTAVLGARIILSVTNPTGTDAEVFWDGQPFPSSTAAGLGAPVVPAGGQAFFATDDAFALGTFTLEIRAGETTSTVQFDVLKAEPKSVALGAYQLDPGHLDLKVGTTYLITVTNTHGLPHNLFIGKHGGAIDANSDTVSPAGLGQFKFTPTTAGEFDMWCNIAGHFESGMFGTVTVSA